MAFGLFVMFEYVPFPLHEEQDDSVRDIFEDKVSAYHKVFTAKAKKSQKGVPMGKYVVSTVLLVFIVFAYGGARADDAHTMTKERLLPLLGKSDIIVIDVRSNHDWDNSQQKIPGSVREEPTQFGSWMKKYPKDKTLVLYCA